MAERGDKTACNIGSKRIALSLLVAVLSLYLASRTITFAEVWSALLGADWRYIVLALTSVAANTFCKAARWGVLLKPRVRQLSSRKLIAALLVGHSLNLIYPARIGDLSRAHLIGRLGPGRFFVLGTVAVEKVLDLLSFAFLFLVLIFLTPLPEWVSSSGYSFISISLLVSLGVFTVALHREKVARLVVRLIERLPGHFQAPLNGRFHAALASLEALNKYPDMFRLAFWSALIYGTAILNNHLALHALGIHLPVTASLLVLVTVQVGITMPSVPGRIGIFEYICVLALAVFGVGQAQAFGFGVLLHAIVLFPSTLLGLLLFFILGISADLEDRSLSVILAGKVRRWVKPEQRYLKP